MKMKTEHFSVKFSKLNEDKEQLTYTDQKLQQFEFIYTLILISAKSTIFTEITADSESIKKNKFKKLKKSISESDSKNVQLLNIKKMTSMSDTVQTLNNINQKKEIMISDYHFKASQSDDSKQRKILKKCKQMLDSYDKKLSSMQRLHKRCEQSDNNTRDKKVEKKKKQEESADLITNLWKKKLKKTDSELKLIKKSETFNLTKLWWKYHLIQSALSHVQMKVITVKKTSNNKKNDNNDTIESMKQNVTDVNENDHCIYNSDQYLNIENVKVWSVNMKTADVKDKNDSLKIAARIISIKISVVNFNHQQAWFDNILYQRENHKETCKHLDIENFKISKISEMWHMIKLYFWQSVTIDAIMKFKINSYLWDCLLEDAVKLDKTFIIISALLVVSIWFWNRLFQNLSIWLNIY